MPSQVVPLEATFEGYIGTTQDALVVFEACLRGQLGHAARPPKGDECLRHVKGGKVYIYEEHASGVKSWIDGGSWSPGHNEGSFVVYHELNVRHLRLRQGFY